MAILHGSVSYAIDQFGEGQGSQSLTTAGAVVSWLLDRHMQLSAGYSFTGRRDIGTVRLTAGQATAVGPSYNDNRVFVQLRLAL